MHGLDLLKHKDLMEQTSLLLFPQLFDSSIDTCCFDNVTDAPGDSVILTTAEVGSLTEIVNITGQKSIFKPGTLWPTHTWFLRIASVHKRLYACVSALEAINN